MQVKPYKDSSVSKKSQVAMMFNNIARRYDFLNHFLSFGIDRYWRRKTIRYLKEINSQPSVILDAATGTCDLAIATLKLNPEKVFGIDIAEEMLQVGRAKIKKKNLLDKIQLLEGDSENLIFEDNKFDAITVGFGVRNFENLLKGLKEFYRVLKPGGVLIVLEFSQPSNKLIDRLYEFYSTKIMARLGRSISKDNSAYSYLHESIEAFPSGMNFISLLQEAGFTETKYEPLTFGVVSIYSGRK